MSEQNFFTSKLLNKKNIANDVLELRFEKPNSFSFKPGQFVQFRIPGAEKSVMRSYSITSSPTHPHLEFCVKLVPGGTASNFFRELEIGNLAEITSPKGVFSCDTPVNKYFIATGVGLAPIMAMLGMLSASDGKAELLFGARTEKDLFWLDRLEKLVEKNSNFTYKITLSGAGENWKGLRGRVTEHIVFNPEGHYFVCGRAEMVKDVRRILVDKGLNTKNVHFEIF